MRYVDDRTGEQVKTHKYLVTATDRFMSGWGECENGVSKCAWACSSLDIAERVFKQVRGRSEMKYVNLRATPWQPRNAKHVHIYVVDAGHPYLD